MSKRRGRPRKNGARDRFGRLVRDARFTPAPDHILAKRKLFAFVMPTKGPDGRTGEIDQDVCDGIGQLHALGALDGYGLDPGEMRDRAREWRDGYVTLLRKSGFKTGSYERMDKAMEDHRYTGRDAYFDRLDGSITGFDRSVLLSLLVDPVVGSWPNGEENAPWVRAIIGERLLRLGRCPPLMRFPDANDHALLEAAIRGLCSLVRGSFEQRRCA